MWFTRNLQLVKQPIYVQDIDTNGNLSGSNDLGSIITASNISGNQVSSDLLIASSRGVKVVLDVTAVGTASLVLHIQGKDKASLKYFDILVGTAVTTISTNIYTVYPGIVAVANVSANDVIPYTFRIEVLNGANPATYTVGVNTLA